MADRIVKDYIKKYSENFTKEQIVQALVENGYSQTLILREYDNLYSKKSSSSFVIFILLIFFSVLVVLGVFYLF